MRYKIGSLGEDYATDYLIQHGYEIITRNYRSRYGEIDIIAQKGGITAFVEVKTRSDDAFALPRESVDFCKRKKIIQTAMQYSAQFPSNTQYRFDIIEVMIQSKDSFEPISVTYLENAFDAGEG